MTINNYWLLPEGIEEILPPKAMALEQLCRQMIDLCCCWGYELVIPPMIEYLESLLTGTGEDMDLQTFKLTDQLSGRLMGIRADMTPQVARIDAHQLKRNVPTRLCYLGTVLHTRPSKSGETRSPLQLGAELYGHGGIASDIETVTLMLTSLQQVGIKQACLDLGHIGLFRTLSTASSLNAMQCKQVFEALQRKAKDELKLLYKTWQIKDKASWALLELSDLNGDVTVLTEAKKLMQGLPANTKRDIDDLTTLSERITAQSDVSINIDLAELRGYHYHTGMIYTVFVPGDGEGIAFGGRYDDIGSMSEHSRAATGFSTDVKSLLRFQTDQNRPISKIYAPASSDPTLQETINALRNQGKVVIQELQGQQATGYEMGCDKELVIEQGQWLVKKTVKPS